MREIRLNAGIDHGAKAKRGKHENYRQTWKTHGAEVKPVSIRNRYQTREKNATAITWEETHYYQGQEKTATGAKRGKIVRNLRIAFVCSTLCFYSSFIS